MLSTLTSCDSQPVSWCAIYLQAMQIIVLLACCPSYKISQRPSNIAYSARGLVAAFELLPHANLTFPSHHHHHPTAPSSGPTVASARCSIRVRARPQDYSHPSKPNHSIRAFVLSFSNPHPFPLAVFAVTSVLRGSLDSLAHIEPSPQKLEQLGAWRRSCPRLLPSSHEWCPHPSALVGIADFCPMANRTKR